MGSDISGQQFFDALNNRNLQQIEALLDENAELLFPKTQPLHGKRRVVKFLRLLFRKYPELEFTVHHIIRQGDLAAVHWTNRGISRHDESYANEGVTLIEISGNKIRFISDFFKDTEKF